jgi:hypothetical protein
MYDTLAVFNGLRQSIRVIEDTQIRTQALKKVANLEKAKSRERAVEGIGDLVRLAYGSVILDKAVVASLPGISKWIRHLSMN